MFLTHVFTQYHTPVICLLLFNKLLSTLTLILVKLHMHTCIQKQFYPQANNEAERAAKELSTTRKSADNLHDKIMQLQVDSFILTICTFSFLCLSFQFTACDLKSDLKNFMTKKLK